MARKAKAIIHINQHKIKANRKALQAGEEACDLGPVVTVKRGKTNRYGHRVKINGPAEVVYSPEKPLSCGATVWIETYAEVELT